MTDIDPFYKPPVPVTEKRSSGWKKIAVTFVALIIVAGIAVAALPFCPWYQHMFGGDQTQVLRDTQQQIAALQTRVATLEAHASSLNAHGNNDTPPSATPAAPAADIAHLQNDIVALSSAVSAMQNDVKQAGSSALQVQQATQSSLAEAIAFIQLRGSALSGSGFAEELRAMREAAKNDGGFQPLLNALEPFAAQGAPTLAQLQDRLIAAEPDVMQVIAKTGADNWWQRILAELRSLVSIRPLHGGGASDALTDMESALARNDIPGALEALQKLPPDAQGVLNAWQTEADARQKIDMAIADIAAHFTALSTGEK